MSLESTVNYQLNKYPGIKKGVKRLYQRMMYTFSPKIESEGDIIRISPNDLTHEYFFGYYDKSPWDITNRYVLCLKAKDTVFDASPKEKADILLIDTSLPENDDNRLRKIAETKSWNVQQGCMAQWLGPDFSSRILYNDYRNGKYVSVVLDIGTGTERVIPAAVYTVAQDGKTALTLDFSRLYNLRPGYGYYNVYETTKGIALPDAPAVWRVNLENGEIKEILTYKDFAMFQPRPEMQEKEAVHKINHLMISPNGKRFMVLYRWFIGSRKYTRLVTCDVDGSNMYLLSDDDMVSHCFWKNSKEIFAFENKKSDGQGYYLMKDKTQEFEHKWVQLSNDGHPSYSPDGSLIVTDSYPNRRRIAEIKILKEDFVLPIVRVFAPFKYDNDTRCDLHPRWSRDGKWICFDSTHEGHRGLYAVSVPQFVESKKEFKGQDSIVYLMTGCKKRGPTNQTLNIIKNINVSQYNPILLTLYTEVPGDSMIEKFLPHVSQYFSLRTNLKKLLHGDTKRLYEIIDKINPVVVHTVGLFPAWFMLKYKKNIHCTTVRNDIYIDYPAKFGKLKGILMTKLNEKVLKTCPYVYTCSQSLSELYKIKIGIEFPYIRNGVDTTRFVPKFNEKKKFRKKLGLPGDKMIMVFTGAFVGFKDQRFAIEGFLKSDLVNNGYLILLGDGPLLSELKAEFGKNDNILFTGFVSNTQDYLAVADMFVSCSKSEGMPNGVLEALSCGLPVLLSDIPQHLEVLGVSDNIGWSYKIGCISDFISKLNEIENKDLQQIGKICREVIVKHLSATVMSTKYQEEYEKIKVNCNEQ